MTSSVVPQVASALDPALPGLAAALSAHPPGTEADDVCRVRHVEWVPRRRCHVVQEIRAPQRTTALVTYEVTPSGTTVHGLADDGDLPGLPAALNPTQVRDRLAGTCGAPIRGCRVTPIAHRPAVRAVVAYDVVAAPGRSRFYAKLLAHGAERYVQAAAAIAESARRRAAPALTPEVVALWSDLGAVVQRDAPGRVLSAVLRDESVPDGERLRHADRLGRLLAGVHASPCGSSVRWGAEDELAALEMLLAPACHADPAVGRSLAALVDRLADTVPPDTDLVLSHGAFRTGQVVVDGGVLALLDLDTVSGSDAARDAGNALAYLSWADVRGALRPGLVPALHEAFLAGYAADRTELRPRTVAWWSAAAMAKIAGRRFRSLATTEWPSVPALLGRAAAQLAPVRTVPVPRRLPAEPDAVPPVDLLDPHRMTEILRGQPSLRVRGGVRVVGARALAEAAGRRRVVRYEVEGLDPGGVVPLIGKVHADRHRSSIAHQNLRLLGEEVFAATPPFAVPTPVCHVPALRMTLCREVAGTPLDRLPAGAGATVAGLAGGWLATLHGSAVVLARRLDLAHEVANVEAWAAQVGGIAPDARTAAYDLAGRLSAAAADLPAAAEVPVHKDLHPGHVIALGYGQSAQTSSVDPGGVVVLDLDEARMGDPALDVAHVTAYLDASAWPGAPGARAAFLDGYGPLPGPDPEARLAFFAAYTGMKIAKQLVTGRGPVLPPEGTARTAALAAVLRRGAACLNG